MGPSNENHTNVTDPVSSSTTLASSSTNSSAIGSEIQWADYVRIMLLRNDYQKVLLRHMDQHWDLPYFVFTPCLSSKVTQCCIEFQQMVGFDKPYPIFNVVADILGECAAMRPRGYDKPTVPGYGILLLVESRVNVDSLSLHDGFSWHDAQFVSTIEKDLEYDDIIDMVFEVVSKFLTSQDSVNRLLPFPPFQFGWFDRAVDWFVARTEQLDLEVVGPIVQHHVSYSSTILKLETKQGDFFLKSPRVGSFEILVTEEMSKLFPQNAPYLVATNEDLRAFIIRGFNTRRHVDRDQIQIVRTLGRMQLESVSHVKDLINAGVPRLSLEELEQKFNAWVYDESFKKCLRMNMRRFEAVLPKLTTIISELKKYNFPLCILHGDFEDPNTGFHTLDDRTEHMLIFDWQFSRISHPLFDFHEVHRNLAEDALEAYLSIWDDYEPLHRARDAYNLAKILGWAVQIETTLPYISADFQLCSTAEEFVNDCFQRMEDRLCSYSKEE